MEPTPYQQKKITPLRLLAMSLRGLTYLLAHWPLFVLIAVLASPVGPHLLVSYHGWERQGHMVKTSCTYLGSRGWIETHAYDDCPYVRIIDTRGGYR